MAQPASAATQIKGTVSCGANTDGAVVGIWVETNKGGNGWATRKSTLDPRINNYSKAIPSTATKVTVKVGCGGTPDKWAATYVGSVNVATGSFSATKDWICLVSYGAKICR